jgi:hypothetical protein
MNGFFNDVNPQTVSQASDGFKEFRIGENHAYISKVEEKVSKESRNPMLEITFADEDGATIKYYIVDGEFKLSKLKQLYLAFGIPLGEANIQKWIGKWGVVVCKADKPYNDKIYNKVSYVKPPDTARKPEPQYGEEEDSEEPEFSDDIPF